MFPIKNISGRTIAFGGRALDPEDSAKYMNSPETKIYNKSDILFGFDISKDHIRKKKYAIVVEGYTDFLRLFVSGFTNIVAGSGTALTQGHSKMLKRFTKKVMLCYDGDEAGQKATVRAGFIFLKAGFDVKVIVLPEKDDPDSFLVENGADAFTEKIKNAPDFLRFILNRNKKKLQSPVEKSEFIERMVKEISEIEDTVVRDFIVKNLAESMSINEERIFGQMKHFLVKKKNTSKFKEEDEEKDQPKIPVIESAVDKAEFLVIQLTLTQKPDIIEYIFHHIDVENLLHPIAKKILHIIIKRMDAEKSIEAQDLYLEEWTKEERILLTKTVADSHDLEEKDLELLKSLALDCIEIILLHQINNEINEIRIKMKNAQQTGDDVIQLMHDYKNRQEQKKLISEELRNLGEQK